ncbi:MAG: DUF433 domain-containing protein, partial [Chloroflexota bacterium]
GHGGCGRWYREAAAMWYDRFIEEVPGVQGGEPVVRETRTPVRTIAGYFNAYHGKFEEVQNALPHLTQEQIEAAMDYYRDHRAEIEGHVERHRQALLKVHGV